MPITGTGTVTVDGSARVYATTIREQIITGFELLLGSVTTANGYHSDAGLNVVRCRKSLDPSELPCIVLWPGMEIAERADYGETFYSMRMGIAFHELLNGENPSVVVERMLGDLVQSVFSSGANGTQKILHVDSILYESGGADTYPDTGALSVSCIINLQVKYNYLYGNPYSPSGG